MAISGQKTVATAGTEVVLGVKRLYCPLMVKALPSNTGVIYIGESSGGVSSSTGMPLSAGDVVVFDFVKQLSSIWIDATVNGEGVAWLALSA